MRHLTESVLVLVLLALPTLAQRGPNPGAKQDRTSLCAVPAAAQIAPDSSGKCPKGTKPCGSACVDLKNDLGNCGKCGRACASGQLCYDGKCKNIPTCKPGKTLCGGKCVNLDKDWENCGACGYVCPRGQRCSAGKCKDFLPSFGTGGTSSPGATTGPSSCQPFESWCNGSCVSNSSFLNDDQNCGRCNHSCSFSESCRGGSCDCAAGYERCMGSCVSSISFMSDTSHCGSCYHSCSIGEQCLGGSCRKLEEQSVAGSRKSAAPSPACSPGDIACMERTLSR